MQRSRRQARLIIEALLLAAAALAALAALPCAAQARYASTVVVGSFSLTVSQPVAETVALSYNLGVSGQARSATGAEGLPDPELVVLSDGGSGTATVTDWEPQLDGYEFLGWSESPGSEEASYKAGDPIGISQDTVLYAVWKAKADDGAADESAAPDDGQAVGADGDGEPEGGSDEAGGTEPEADDATAAGGEGAEEQVDEGSDQAAVSEGEAGGESGASEPETSEDNAGDEDDAAQDETGEVPDGSPSAVSEDWDDGDDPDGGLDEGAAEEEVPAVESTVPAALALTACVAYAYPAGEPVQLGPAVASLARDGSTASGSVSLGLPEDASPAAVFARVGPLAGDDPWSEASLSGAALVYGADPDALPSAGLPFSYDAPAATLSFAGVPVPEGGALSVCVWVVDSSAGAVWPADVRALLSSGALASALAGASS